MGTPIEKPFAPDPVGAGSACSRCWGVGKPFGDGDTPETVSAIVSGMNKAPGWVPSDGEPPNGTFELEQLSGIPCQWKVTSGDFKYELLYRAVDSLFTIRTLGDVFVGFGNTASLCETRMEQLQESPFIGGSIQIYIPEVV